MVSAELVRTTGGLLQAHPVRLAAVAAALRGGGLSVSLTKIQRVLYVDANPGFGRAALPAYGD